MKIVWRVFAIALIILTVSTPIFISESHAQTSSAVNCYVGVTYGGDSVAGAEQLIDKVSSYSNLFIVDSWTISGAPNDTALNEICDYAVNANMYIIVYFNFIFQNMTLSLGNLYNATTWNAYGYSPWHVSWLNSAREQWGDKFLGAYLYDEPGGKQIDDGYWDGANMTFSGRPVTTFANVTTYDQAASTYVSSIARSGSMQVFTNTSYRYGLNSPMPVFVSDYALYWFDYKAGYSTVFAELGNSETASDKIEQIDLCRGAAESQNRDWGAIITWETNNPPTLESGPVMLKDMTMAYNAGAKYVLVFDYQINGKGALTDDQFNAIKQFWTNIHSSSSDSQSKYTGQVAFVLPTNYGWGMRTENDKIWGFWPADNNSAQIWSNMNKLISKYGLNLDIVYADPQVSIQGKYTQTYMWNSTINPVANSSNALPNEIYILASAAVSIGAVTCGSTFFVMKRKKQKITPVHVEESTMNHQIVVIAPTAPVKKTKIDTEFSMIFNDFADVADPLFDLLIGLNGKVNWGDVEISLKRCKLATSNFSRTKISTENLNFQNLSLAIKSHALKGASQEALSIMNHVFENVSALGVEANFSEELQSNYGALKSSISAYFMLNDVLLGQIVGDREIGKERSELVNVLKGFLGTADINPENDLFAETIDELGQEKIVTKVAESRSLLRKQLDEFLNRKSKE